MGSSCHVVFFILVHTLPHGDGMTRSRIECLRRQALDIVGLLGTLILAVGVPVGCVLATKTVFVVGIVVVLVTSMLVTIIQIMMMMPAARRIHMIEIGHEQVDVGTVVRIKAPLVQIVLCMFIVVDKGLHPPLGIPQDDAFGVHDRNALLYVRILFTFLLTTGRPNIRDVRHTVKVILPARV